MQLVKVKSWHTGIPQYSSKVVAISHVLQLHSCQMRQDHAIILAFGLAVHQPCALRRALPSTPVLGPTSPGNVHPRPP
jgi:hypothetical protein